MKNAGVKERKQQIHCSMAKRFTRQTASSAWVRNAVHEITDISSTPTFIYLNPSNTVYQSCTVKNYTQLSHLHVEPKQANTPSLNVQSSPSFFLLAADFHLSLINDMFICRPTHPKVAPSYLQVKADLYKTTYNVPTWQDCPYGGPAVSLGSASVLLQCKMWTDKHLKVKHGRVSRAILSYCDKLATVLTCTARIVENIAFLSTRTIDSAPKLLRVTSGLEAIDAHTHKRAHTHTHTQTDMTHSHGDLTHRFKSRHTAGNSCTQSSADGSAPPQLFPAAAGHGAARRLSYKQMSSVRTWFRGSTLLNHHPHGRCCADRVSLWHIHGVIWLLWCTTYWTANASKKHHLKSSVPI